MSTPSPGPTSSPSLRQPTPRPRTGPVSPDRQLGALPLVKLRGMVDPPAGSGYERYTKQQVSWNKCGGYECATVLAPMDYTNPDGIAITLNVKRRPATGPKQGSIFVNPGGPGAAGSNMVAGRRWDRLNQAYDIVGWDPRGTGQSTPVKCYANDAQATKAVDAFLYLDMSPDNDAEYNTYVEGATAFADSCATYSGLYLQYITSIQVVQDMDLLRQVVGDQKLNFLGYSYGTYIGAMYAYYFPDNVGHMVLDSAVNITQDTTMTQAQGFDRALGLFAQWSAQNNKIGATKDEVIAKIVSFLDELDSQPIMVGSRMLSQSLAVTGIITPLYGTEDEWAQLEQALSAAYTGDGQMLLAFADAMNQRDSNGTYGQMYFSFPAMMCADSEDDGLVEGRKQWLETQKKAPIFGKYFGPSVMCERWHVPPAPEMKITAPTAAPIVVVGATGDPATPYEYSGWMAHQLGDKHVLLTFDGPGHGTYGGTNRCIDDAVNAYLLQDQVPAKGTICKQ